MGGCPKISRSAVDQPVGRCVAWSARQPVRRRTDPLPERSFRAVSRLLNYFLKGLAFVVPIAVTVYVCVEIFEWIDGGLGVVIERWLHRSVPGAGFVLTLVLITSLGFFASNLLTR